MEMTVKEVLIAARAKIADPANWTQGTLARDVHGTPVGVLSKRASCWCSVGAVAECSTSVDITNEAMFLLAKVCEGPAEAFNDRRTHAEVLAKFDEAIAAQGGE